MEIMHGTLTTLSVFGILCQAAITEANGVIINGTIWHDTNGDEIWCNGGHMIREGNIFYWVGYETRPGQHQWNTKLYSSSNLTDWKFENSILTKEGKFAILGWAGRPGLLYNRASGKYVLVFEADSKNWYRHKVGFASCDSISGKYQFAGYQYPEEERSTGDQSVYQEGDDAYLVTVLDHPDQKPLNYSLAIFKLSSDFLSIEMKVFEGFENGGREAPHIIKVGDTYYWFTSGLKGWKSTATMYSTANSLNGPWSELKTLANVPDSPDSFNTQHDFIIPVSGAFGQLYGNSPIWHFGSAGVYDQGGDWVAALDSQGAQDIAHLASLFRSLPWWMLRADHEHKVVTAGFGTFGQPDYVTTARTMDGTQVLSYIPSTGTERRELSVDLAQLTGKVMAHWFNPVDGSYIHVPGSPFPNTGIQVFTTPEDNGTGTNDWLLLLEVK